MDFNNKCVPCMGGVPKLVEKEISYYLKEINAKWQVSDNKLIRSFSFSEFSDAVKFANIIFRISDEEGHHPYVHVDFKLVRIILFTHKIDGLHENDFLMAGKIDKEYNLKK